ncbi:MAG: Ku protein [Armatimonadota bacterium]
MRTKTRRAEKKVEGAKLGPRAMWTGAISFGLVTVPIRLYPAVREKSLTFHLLDRKQKVRLRRKLVRATDEVEVPYEDQVRGFEVAPDQYVIVTDEELEAAEPKASRLIEIQDFVDLNQIDPIYYNRSYYTMPTETGEKAYRLLLAAMEKTKKAGIGRLVMHNREYLTALRPVSGLIGLETMYFADEIVAADQFELPGEVEVTERELKVAVQLVEAMSNGFAPGKYHDRYREAVRKAIDAKVRGEEIVTAPAPETRATDISDLFAELEKSLAAKKPAARHAGEGARARR